MRAILDTHILLSASCPVGTPARLIDAWLDGRLTLVSHPIQLEEIRDVSRREKIRVLVRAAEVGRLINQIGALAEMPERLPPVELSRDPLDDFLLALCKAGSADLLVTGDKSDLLSLKRHGGTKIITAAAFAKLLRLR